MTRPDWQAVWPLVFPCGLLILGASVGYAFTLDARVAAERLVGVVLASGLAVAATLWLKRFARSAALLLGAAVGALIAALWVISASGSDVFRGPLGRGLQWLFTPVFDLVQLTDPVEIANTRFIIGYNGLADLCVVAICCCGALWLSLGQRRSPRAWMLLATAGLSLLLLVGTGARGGLTGLAAGVCTIGLFAWPRRYVLLAVVAAPIIFAVGALGFLDKGLEFSSTAGRLTYWRDLARLLSEYALTGVGLGVDTAFKATLLYEINPDPERVFYAHNTFVQSYLEMGPPGALGMLLVPLITLGAVAVARRDGVLPERRALFVAGLGIVGALTVHGLTDQVVTTNGGTALLLLGLAAVLAGLPPGASSTLWTWVRLGGLALGALAILGVVGVLAQPAGRAQVLLNIGSLRLNQALALETQAPGRGVALGDAESTLTEGLRQAADHPAILRQLGRARLARYDDAGALQAANRAAQAPRLDAFDTLQIAHLYRELGFADQAYALAARAYAAWGRSIEDSVMQIYAQSTLAALDDPRARTLADQAEAAMRARRFGEAQTLFTQALLFQPTSAYLEDRLGGAQRAVAKYGG